MLKKSALLLLLSLCFQSFIFAEERSETADRIVGTTFKALAKAFVLATDIDKLKQNNIARLEKMDGEKFKKRYAEVYEATEGLPAELKLSYGITEEMPKEQAIKDIKSLDKKKLYGLIDAIPDAIIARQFEQYLSETKQDFMKSNLVEQVTKFWNKLTAAALAAPK